MFLATSEFSTTRQYSELVEITCLSHTVHDWLVHSPYGWCMHARFMSLILVKQCLVRMADDDTLLATLEKSPSEAKLTRIRDILDYNCLGGERL